MSTSTDQTKTTRPKHTTLPEQLRTAAVLLEAGDVGDYESPPDLRSEADLMAQAADEIERLRAALTRLRDCDWTITPLDRMDAVRDIARAALNGSYERPHP